MQRQTAPKIAKRQASSKIKNTSTRSLKTTTRKPIKTTTTRSPTNTKTSKNSFTTKITPHPPHLTDDEIVQLQQPVALNFRKYPSLSETPSKPPLVILHGLLGHANNWTNIAGRQDLRAEHDIYTLDLRNHGASPQPKYIDYVAMANDVAHFITTNTPNKVATVVGHSMGGKTTAAVSLLHPYVISGAVLVDILPVTYKPHSMEEIHNILSTVVNVDFSNNAGRREVDQQLQAGGINSVGIRQWLMTNITSVNENDANYEEMKAIQQTSRWKPDVLTLFNCYHNIRGFDLELPFSRNTNSSGGTTGAYHGPTHLILGGNSSFGSESDALDIMENAKFPESTLSIIKDAGHWCHAEKPNDFSQQLLEFLNKNGL